MGDQIENIKGKSQRVKARLLKITAVQLFFRTAEGAGNHDASQRAAGVTYYALLSIFPLLLGLIAVFGFFLPSTNLQNDLLNFVGKNLPGATDFLRQNIENIVTQRGPMGLLSMVVLFWGASSLFGSISLAINRVWEINTYRPFFVRKASELGMALGTGILFLLSLGASALISVMVSVLGFPPANLFIVDVGSRVVAFSLMLVVFLLLYKLIPNTRTYWRDVWPGALVAALLFEIARTLLVFYLANFANYHLIFGSIASIIALLVWVYYSAFILIMGAEFTFQYGRMRRPLADR